MLRKADDLRARPGLEIGERLQLAVFRLLEVGVDRPAVGTAVRIAQLPGDAVDHVVSERVAEEVGLLVRLGRRIAHEVGEQALDDAVAAHDALGLAASLGREDRLLVLPSLDETFRAAASQRATA